MSLTSAERWAELEHRNAQAFADGFDGAEVNVCLDELRDLIAAARERDTLRERLATAEQALKKYGSHLVGCRRNYGEPRCGCGFDAALAAIKGESRGDS